MIGSVARIILFVWDVPAVAAFYRDKLGLSVIGEIEPGWTELNAGAINIALHHAGRYHTRSGASSPAKVVFQVDDVPATKVVLEADGVRMSEISTWEGIQFCDGRDPAGNPFQISTRHGSERS